MVIRVIFAVFAAAVFWLWLAIPACGCSTRVGAYNAAMKSDLKNVASQQEIYFSDQRQYTADPKDLAFTNSDGVLVDIEVFGDSAWRARATHIVWQSPEGDDFGQDCVIYYGDVPDIPVTSIRGDAPAVPGEITCDYRRRRSFQSRVQDFVFGWL